MKDRFHVKVELELHSITCPGVWLCPGGYIEATLKALGYLFKTGPMEPKFPLLSHDLFVMEGHFKSAYTIQELENALAAEIIEIAIWQMGRRLAFYRGRLGNVLQSVAPSFPTNPLNFMNNGCIHQQALVQLLMTPSKNFPGVLAPKIEMSGRATVKSPNRFRCCFHPGFSELELNCPTETRAIVSHEERHNRTKAVKRQRPVCHVRKLPKAHLVERVYPEKQVIQHDGQAPVYVLAHKLRYQDNSKSSSQNSSRSSIRTKQFITSYHDSSRPVPGSEDTEDESAEGEDDHPNSCRICRSYKSIFSETGQSKVSRR